MESPRTEQPSWRRGVGIAAIVALILLWAALVVSLAPLVGKWPVLAQGLFYLIAGIAWIAPLKPLLRWAQTGRWSAHSGKSN